MDRKKIKQELAQMKARIEETDKDIKESWKSFDKAHEDYKKAVEEYLDFNRKRINAMGLLIWGMIIIWGIYWIITKQYLFLVIALIIGVAQEIAHIGIKRGWFDRK